MAIRITSLCAVALVLWTGGGFATAQDFKAKSEDTRKKANALIEKGNKIIPAKVAGNMKKLAEAQGLSEELFRAYLKSGRLLRPKV